MYYIHINNLNKVLTESFHIISYCFTFIPIFILSNNKQNFYFMYQFTEVILPILFICLVSYLIGSVARLLINLIIPEQCK